MKAILSFYCIAGLCIFAASGAAAEIDISKLPPPATAPVDFLRDIQPILQESCIRCHGPEKPKSGYRLDNRAAAIKGGDNGVAIIPGRSAESRFIHYVARLVEDMEMPPPGKGEPLTRDQIGLLRAWIDQDVPWASAEPTNVVEATISPSAGWLFVNGDNHKFREHYSQRDGFQGGIEQLELFQQTDPDTRSWVTARALRDDYRVTLKVERKELGFVSAGWEQYRKYYDDTGGYLVVPPQSLGSDLHLDLGKAWIDFGLTLPRWPRMVLGYEYDYKQGNESITSWSSDFNSSEPRNIAPAAKRLDEGVHVIKFDLNAEVGGVTIEDRFRGEFYNLKTHYTNSAARASVAQNVHRDETHFQGANSIRLEKKLTRWLLGSGGYFYSKLNADDSFSNVTVANDTYAASVPRLELTRETHLFNLNALAGPFDGLTVHGGVQSEWNRQHGFGRGNLNGIAYTRSSGTLMISPATLSADYDQNSVTENVGLRYTRIPFTSLIADARLKQEAIDQSNRDIQTGPSFVENPSFTSRLADFRAGFNTSPWRQVSLSAHYRYYENESHYKTNDVPQPEGGYPGLIRDREVATDEVEARLVVRPASWLKTTLAYQILSTDYRQTTRLAYDLGTGTTNSSGGHILSGEQLAHVYSVGLTVTPRRRWALTATFSYQDSETTTPSQGTLRPYKGDIYSALLGGTYILNPKTDLSVNYSFSYADFSKPDSTPNPSGPPPLGIRYEQHALQAAVMRHVSKNLTTRLQYAFYRYEEPSVGGVNDYNAHSIFATLAYRFP